MFNLFNKKKVFAGKQNNDEKKPAAAAAGAKTDAKNAKPAPFAALGKTWAKLNKMDRKQAYTWGAVAVVALVALITLGSVVGGGSEEDFAAFETRGYDLANMPFSSDEAEQYLLASKYPDMQNTNASGLYSKAEKEARQAEDAEEAAAQLDTSVTSEASEYVPGRYYGGGSSGSVTPTQVGTLNSASLKGASGSGVSGTFGPSGDFSNFRSQDKGQDVFNAQQGRGSGNARQALFQTAVGSRAAAGQKDNRLVNAKKAMMGGNIKGSDAFLSDSGAVDLSKAAGLNLDTNAPISSVDPGLFDDALKDAQQEAEDTAQEEEEQEWWQTMLQDMAKQIVTGLISMGMNTAQGAMEQAQAAHNAEAAAWQEQIASMPEYPKTTARGTVSTDQLGDLKQSVLDQMGLEYNSDKTQLMKGDTVVAKASVKDGVTSWDYEEGQTIKIGRWDEKKIRRADEKWFAENYPEQYTQAKAYAKQAGYNAKSKVPPSRTNFNGNQNNELPDPKIMGEGATRTIGNVTYVVKNGKWVNQ